VILVRDGLEEKKIQGLLDSFRDSPDRFFFALLQQQA
jgi:hypothetical protein